MKTNISLRAGGGEGGGMRALFLVCVTMKGDNYSRPSSWESKGR